MLIPVLIAVMAVFFFAQPVVALTCGGVDTAVLECGGNGGGNGDISQSGVWKLLELALTILIGVVGIAAVGGIVYGAIMYASAQDNASQVQQAVGIIRNVIIGLALFILMWSVLQYLIPGGLFG